MIRPKLSMAARRFLLRAGAAALVAGIAYAGWIYWRSASVKPLDQRYRLEEVSSGDVTQTVTANGTLNPVVLVNVGTQVSGTVKKLYADFRRGAGQILLGQPNTFGGSRTKCGQPRERRRCPQAGARQRAAFERAVRPGVCFETGS